MKEIDQPNWEYAHRIFQCVTAASRPFRVEELAEFLAFDFDVGPTPAFLADWRPEDPTHTVLSTCSSLLAVVDDEPTHYDTPSPSESPVSPPSRDGGAPLIPPDLGPTMASIAIPQVYPAPIDDEITILPEPPYFPVPSIESALSPPLAAQFAHFSVKEYLTSARLAKEKDSISRFHVSMTPAHTIIAQACLGVLLHLDENITNSSLKKFPLAEYAAKHWVDHARFENVASNVLDGMKRLFDPSKNHLSVWVWIYDPENPRPRRSESPAAARATPLHYAAFYGLHDVATFLIVERSEGVNARGFGGGETPLHVSSRRGHVDITRVLLKHGADTETRDNSDFSPLEDAAQGGHVELAQVLLEHGAYVNTRDATGCTPLYLASGWGNPAIVRALLKNGADVTARLPNNETPFHRVHEEEVALLLLEHGADANALGVDNQTPLHRVSESVRVGVARVLLEHGVDANARDANNKTPLHLASGSRYREVPLPVDFVRLLLQYGSDIHARDDEGQTPFMIATAKGHDDVMQLLLENGAEDHRL